MAGDFNQLAQLGNALTGFSNVANQAFTYGYPKHEILTVNSYQEVKDFKINKNDTYDFIDPNADLLYIKEKDSIGKESIKIYSLTDVTEDYQTDVEPVNISRKEYNSLVTKIDELVKKMDGGRNASKKSEQPELAGFDKPNK